MSMAGDFMEGNEFTAIDAAGAAWSIKSILSNVQRTSFLIEIFVLAITALAVILTIFLAIKLLRILFGCLKMVYEKISDKFGALNFSATSITSIPMRIFYFIRKKIFKKNSPS